MQAARIGAVVLPVRPWWAPIHAGAWWLLRRSAVLRVPAALPWVIGALAITTVIIFDFGPNLGFNDDWLYAWSAAHVSWSGIPRLPIQAASGYVQAVWGYVMTAGQPEPYTLRLSVLPFVALASYSSYSLARRLRASRLWAGFAGVALLTTPVYLNLSTSFMTDVPYIALLLAAADAAVAWLQDGKRRLLCIALVALATLQRQIAVVFPVPLTLALLLGRKERRLDRLDALYLGLLWVVAAVVHQLPVALGSATPVEQSYISYHLFHPDLGLLWRSVGYLPASLGFFLLPFAAALLFQARSERRWPSFLSAGAALLGTAGLVAVFFHFRAGQSLLPGDIWMDTGFVPTSWGPKPAIFPAPLRTAIELLATITFVALLLVAWKQWSRSVLGTAGFFLVLLAAVQTVETILAFTFDRYYLVIAALLVPVLAAAATRTTLPRLATAWACAAAVIGVALYAVAQQDYEAWQQARDQAAQLAYSYVPAAQVHAGYEPNAAYVTVPEYERLGGNVDIQGMLSFLIVGPEHPSVVLMFAKPDDPRPGVSYSSLAPGKIVISGDLPARRQP